MCSSVAVAVTGGEEVRRPTVAGSAGLLQARRWPAVPTPGAVPLPAYVQGHQGGPMFLLFGLPALTNCGHLVSPHARGRFCFQAVTSEASCKV